MILTGFLRKVFSKQFQIILLIGLVGGATFYLRFPHSFYDYVINSISGFLKTKYGTNGNTQKIESGLHKIAFMVSFLCFAFAIYIIFLIFY